METADDGIRVNYRGGRAVLAERSPEDPFNATVVPVAEMPGADDQVARHAGPGGLEDGAGAGQPARRARARSEGGWATRAGSSSAAAPAKFGCCDPQLEEQEGEEEAKPRRSSRSRPPSHPPLPLARALIQRPDYGCRQQGVLRGAAAAAARAHWRKPGSQSTCCSAG